MRDYQLALAEIWAVALARGPGVEPGSSCTLTGPPVETGASSSHIVRLPALLRPAALIAILPL